MLKDVDPKRIRIEHRTVFLWWPTEMYELSWDRWVPTGKTAWLKKVRRIHTIYGDVIHRELNRGEE